MEKMEGQKNLILPFMDLKKADDRVPKEEIWRCMMKSNVPE